MNRAAITTHILHLHSGTPAAGVKVQLQAPDTAAPSLQGRTDNDGRISHWSADLALRPGTWVLTFDTDGWFADQGQSSFYPNITIAFNVVDTEQHYHVPLLLNAYGYSTYRGS